MPIEYRHEGGVGTPTAEQLATDAVRRNRSRRRANTLAGGAVLLLLSLATALFLPPVGLIVAVLGLAVLVQRA